MDIYVILGPHKQIEGFKDYIERTIRNTKTLELSVTPIDLSQKASSSAARTTLQVTVDHIHHTSDSHTFLFEGHVGGDPETRTPSRWCTIRLKDGLWVLTVHDHRPS